MPRVRIYLDAHARVYFTPLGFSSLFRARAHYPPKTPFPLALHTRFCFIHVCVCAGELLVIY